MFCFRWLVVVVVVVVFWGGRGPLGPFLGIKKKKMDNSKSHRNDGYGLDTPTSIALSVSGWVSQDSR